jgi:Tfp pilus assembly protein PilF
MTACGRARGLVDEAFERPERWERNLAEADGLLRAAIQSEPERPELLTALGAVLCDRLAFEEAVAVLERALELGSQDRNTHFNLGVALLGTARSGEATAAFRRASSLAASPATWEAYFDPHAQ